MLLIAPVISCAWRSFIWAWPPTASPPSASSSRLFNMIASAIVRACPRPGTPAVPQRLHMLTELPSRTSRKWYEQQQLALPGLRLAAGIAVAQLVPVATIITRASLVFAFTLGVIASASAQIIVPGRPYGYRYAAPDAAVKFDVKPKEAAVYVDGYYAGLVDDYDGAFQRLRTAPGGHEITVYLEGYRTYTERAYLTPDNTLKIRHRMERLGPGETAQRPPAPPPPPQYQPGE